MHLQFNVDSTPPKKPKGSSNYKRTAYTMNYLLLYISNNPKKQLLLPVYVPFFAFAHTVKYTRK